MAQLGSFIALLELQQHFGDAEGAGHGRRGLKGDVCPKNHGLTVRVCPHWHLWWPWVPDGTSWVCPAGLCVHSQQYKALSLWQSDGVINFRAIVLWWQALIYSPGNSFWFKVHIRCVNAP